MKLTEANFQKVLGELMEKNSIREAELARRTHVPPATLNRLMMGITPDPRLSTLRPLARYFGIRIDQLIGDEPLVDLRIKDHVFVPIIPWDKAHECKEFIKTLDFQNWSKWEPTTVEASKDTYALIIEQRTLGMPFTYHSIVLVDPDKEAKDGDYVIVYQPHNEAVSLKHLVIEGKEKWLNSPSENMKSILMSDDYKICGVIVRAILPFNKD